MRIAAFDMGTRNFAFCVEEYEENELTSHKIKPSFDMNGCPNESYTKELEKIYKNGKLIYFEKIDIQQLNTQGIYLTLTYILNNYKLLWDSVDVFLIEQQMAYGKNKSNIQALRLAQHCLSYFYTIYGSFKEIKEFGSTHKTRILGCSFENRKTHKKRKNFSIELASKILCSRNDSLISQFDLLDKKDDISDCILMIQSFKVRGG